MAVRKDRTPGRVSKGNPNPKYDHLIEWRKKNGHPPRKEDSIRTLAAEHSTYAFMEIVAIAQEATTPIKTRFAALQYIVDRAHGKPAQSVDIGGQKDNPVQVNVTIHQK